MALRYSRDGASRPRRVLEACLADTRQGKFKPDETRSGRFVMNVVPPNPSETSATVDDVRVKQEVLSSAMGVFEAGEVIEVESDHATTCSESSSGDDAVVLPKLPHRTLLIPQGVDVWKHTKLKTVHLAPEGYVRILACGRKITESYQRGGIDVRFDIIKCKQCFNSALFQKNS